MSSDNPQNPEQPDEFEDLMENENAPNQNPEPAATPPEPAPTPAPTPTPTPAPSQPEPTKPDQSPQPEGKVDPTKIQEKDTKSLQEQLERLRKERENQDGVISRLTSASTKLQGEFDSAEKQHKVQQENAVEVASKAAVRQVTKERDNEHRGKQIVSAVAAVAFILFCLITAHDLFESTPAPATGKTTQTSPAARQPTTVKEEEDPIVTGIKAAMKKTGPDTKIN